VDPEITNHVLWPTELIRHKKWVSYLHRTAQPFTLAAFRPWGISTGASRTGLTRGKSRKKSLASK
jgi:hypothetical protein